MYLMSHAESQPQKAQGLEKTSAGVTNSDQRSKQNQT